MDTRLIDALFCENDGRPPVWLMRQAGRYMSTYRALKEKHSFHELCFQPELIYEVTMMPIDQLDVDAAILFSDILLPLISLGIDVVYEESQGPLLSPAIRNREQLSLLRWEGFGQKFEGIPKAIEALRGSLSVPLLGFAGAPFTLASYLIEGKTSKELRYTKQWMMRDPEGFQVLLDLLATVSASFLSLQIQGGAQAVQIFDTWAQSLDFEHFKKYSLEMMKKVKAQIPSHIPVIFFSRGGDRYAEEIARAQPEAVSVDWTVDLESLRKRVPDKVAIQGNLDPSWLYAPRGPLKNEVDKLLRIMEGHEGYIFNLGHGILPDTPLDHVKYLVELIKK